MRSTSTQTAQDLKQLRAEVTRLTNIVKEMPEHVKSDASNVIGFNSKELRKMAREAGKNARRFVKDKKEQVSELRDEAEDRISSNPFRAVGIAASIGAMFGAVFGFTRRS